jgi:hypothetical protein
MEIGGSWPVTGRIFRTAVLALAVSTALGYSQPEPRTFFKDRIHLSDADIGKIDQGQIVTKTLDSGDKKYGMLVFGAVYVNAPVEKFSAVVRDIKGLTRNKVYLAVQEFSSNGAPPKLSDFDRLELDKGDVDELETCKPGDCDIQIMENLAEFQKRVDWKSKNKYDQANNIERERLNQAMTVYMEHGLKPLGSYRDREKPAHLYGATKSMIDEAYYLPQDKVGGIYRQLVDYPHGKFAGATNLFYWEKIDFGQEPTIRINHLSLFPAGVGGVQLLAANEQLYASRYMRVALQMFYCVPDTSNPNRPGFYLIEMNDSRLPDFGGLKLGIVRKVATGKAADATRDTLQMYQKDLAAR